MLGTLVNTISVLVGSTIGMVVNKGIPQRIADQMMRALGLCSIFIGIQGAFKGENTLIMIISMVIGVVIGEGIDIDKHITNGVNYLEKKFVKKQTGKHTISEGLITSSLLFCVGSMTIVGCLNAGMLNDYTMLYTKSTLDFCSSMIFASTLGIGVMLSAVVILIYQGGLTLLAMFAAPLLTTSVINEMTCVGSLVIIATGLNLLGVTKIKLMNYIPAMFLPIILCLFM
ncbi:MAG: DUF554 domain-containing protein [Coprobacillus cateniformis]|uniref:DUF554 domain-containing protein n=1 Tax=Longibaculum muris TaxID=1796628 RepID=UPI003AB72B69|nr:DUF554 domain-containing protein [Coprobacillus cateniformis]